MTMTETERPALASDEAVPTAVFFADPRASSFLLSDTISSMLGSYNIQRAYIDVSNQAGLVIAGELLRAGIAYELLDFGQEIQEVAPRAFVLDQERTAADVPYLRTMSAGTHAVAVEDLASIDANVVLIPAMADERLINFSTTSVVGTVLTQAEESGRELLVITPPERGLRPVVPTVDPDAEPATTKRYELQTILVRPEGSGESHLAA